jgi:hypothetical protein
MAAQPTYSWLPLGRLFVDRGLLSEEHLEEALADQAENGGKLGEKLVELGYVSSTALARLLAEQYGVELTLDTGFGTGLFGELERRQNGDGTVRVVPDAPLRRAERRRGERRAAQPLGGLVEQWARLAAAEARVVELESLIKERDEQIAELTKPRRSGRTPKASDIG